MEALITSVDDPQLERCLVAVHGQTVPFSNVIHLNNVCPNSEAINMAMRMSTDQWVMWLGGDMILDLDAVARITGYIHQNDAPNVCGYYFGLYDTFLDCKIGYVGILNGPLYRTVTFSDSWTNDREMVNKFRSKGWVTRKNLNLCVGTHFDQPNELQVFTRFYIHGVRYRDRIKGRLGELGEKTRNPLYRTGIKAIEYAQTKNFYPGSHNLMFDRKNYEEYKSLYV